jgi:hypothetical protein
LSGTILYKNPKLSSFEIDRQRKRHFQHHQKIAPKHTIDAAILPLIIFQHFCFGLLFCIFVNNSLENKPIMYRLAKIILTILIDTKLFVGLCAVLVAFSTYHILGLKPSPEALFFVFSSTLLAYTIHVVFHANKKKLDLAMFCIAVVLASISGALFFFTCNNKLLIPILGGLGVLMTAYYLPKGRNLRSIPYIKSFVISLAWTTSTVLLPIVSANAVFDTNALVLSLERIILIFALTVPFDIKDLSVDKKQGITTVPILLGLRKSVMLCIGLLIAYLLITFVHNGFSDILFVRFVTVWYLLVLLQGINLHRSKYYYSGAIDGSLILQPLLTILIV